MNKSVTDDLNAFVANGNRVNDAREQEEKMSVATSAESLVPEPLQRQAACPVSTGGPLPRPIQLSVVDRLVYTDADEFVARPRGSGACAFPAELGALACAFVGMARLATLAQAKDSLRAQLCRLGMYPRRPKLHRF